jgi:hypothetical protein
MTQEERNLKIIEWSKKPENSNTDIKCVPLENKPYKSMLIIDPDSITMEQWKELEAITGCVFLNKELTTISKK